MTEQNTRLGILLVVISTAVFSAQDALSRHLAESYNVWMVVMIRYWFFAAFVSALAARAPGGLRAAIRTRQPVLQALRGVILVLEIYVVISAFMVLGLVETHAAFASAPLVVAALSGPVLGEKVGWRRWAAIAVGFVGILVILQPGSRALSPMAMVPFLAAVMYATYVVLTRYVARLDRASTSLFWTGLAGSAVATAVGLWFWEPMTLADWGWMTALCLTATLGHWLVIRGYELAEASAVQPFVYLQLVFASTIGIVVFHDRLSWNIVLGAVIVVSAGLFTFWRERVRARHQAGR